MENLEFGAPLRFPKCCYCPVLLGITGGSRNLQPHLAVMFLNYSENKHWWCALCFSSWPFHSHYKPTAHLHGWPHLLGFRGWTMLIGPTQWQHTGGFPGDHGMDCQFPWTGEENKPEGTTGWGSEWPTTAIAQTLRTPNTRRTGSQQAWAESKRRHKGRLGNMKHRIQRKAMSSHITGWLGKVQACTT